LLTRKAGFEPRGTEIVNDEDTLTVVLDRQNTRLQEPWAWTPLPYPRATLEVAFLQPDQVQLSEDVYRARGPWHQEEHRRLRATSRALRGDFVTVLYPRREDLPALTLNQSDVAGFERCLQWPSAVDFLDQDGRLAGTAHGGDGEWALVRETKAVDGVCYLLTDGTRLEFRGRPLVETRGLGPYGQVSVTCDGQTLAVHAHLQQNARWQVERQGVLRAYGPQVQNAVVNGVPAPFTREGDHVWVPIRTRRFVSTAERITQRIQQKYDQGEALGER
jgi:hypothetical protein